MHFRTIFSIALATVVIANAASADAGARTLVVSTPVVTGDRTAAADGFGDNNSTRHQDWHFVPLTGVIDKDPPLAGNTPGILDKPGLFTQTFSPDGKSVVEIKLACLTAAPLGIKIVNVGDATVPAGTMLRWSVKASNAAGAFALPGGLGGGQAVLVKGYKGSSKGSPCAIKLLS